MGGRGPRHVRGWDGFSRVMCINVRDRAPCVLEDGAVTAPVSFILFVRRGRGYSTALAEVALTAGCADGGLTLRHPLAVSLFLRVPTRFLAAQKRWRTAAGAQLPSPTGTNLHVVNAGAGKRLRAQPFSCVLAVHSCTGRPYPCELH